MSVTIKQVQTSKKVTLRNLYSLYLRDLSAFTSKITIGKEVFEYESLDEFWSVKGCPLYFTKFDGDIIDFILLLERPSLTEENDFGINDIFILSKYIGTRIGKRVDKRFED